MTRLVFFGCMLLAARLAAGVDTGGTDFPPPAPNHPWMHARSGLRFPDALAGMTCEGGFTYNDPVLGESLRYLNPKLRVRADVYVFPCPQPSATPEEMREAAKQEASNSLAGIREAEKRGVYSGVRQGDAAYSEISLYPEGSGKTCLLEFPVDYSIMEESAAGKSESKVTSYTGIMVYRAHLVKIRCSYPSDGGKETEDQVNKFIGRVRLCVLDPGMRVEIQQHIQTYLDDPLSDAARDAAGRVVAYAELTPLIHVDVPDKMVQLGSGLEAQLKNATLDFLGAYLVGAMKAGLEDPLPEKLDLEQGGAEQLVRVFDLLKKKNPELKSPDMAALAAATQAGKGGQWLRE